MAAQQQNLETIADDLANADVAGFKGSAQRFAELAAPGEAGVGNGGARRTRRFSRKESSRKSGGPFDLAIEGPGFFHVVDERGRHLYTRDGSFERAPPTDRAQRPRTTARRSARSRTTHSRFR